MPEFVNPFSGMVPKRTLTDGELVRALRLDLAAEHEAVHTYLAHADATENPLAKTVLIDIANEERVHGGEFARLISILSGDEDVYLMKGTLEVDVMVASLAPPEQTPPQNKGETTIGSIKQSEVTKKMEKTYLGREDAPISAETWKLLDTTMNEAAKSHLSGRRLLSIDGPFGFGLKVIPLSDFETPEGITTSAFIPVKLVTTSFFLNKRDLAASERDRLVLDAGPVAGAAITCAAKEDDIIFNGTMDVPGLLKAEGIGSLTLTKWDKVGAAADQIISAVTTLDDAGFHGPYSMALAPAQYNLLLRRHPQGDGTELDHCRTILAGDVIKATVLKKGGVVLASGRQYSSLVMGQDMSIGYNGPCEDSFEFSISESLALLIRAPESICVLK